MLGIGQKFPQFSLTGVVSNDLDKAFQTFTQDSQPGKWRVLFFWPKDFTFVCPTEIAAFGKLEKEFKARDAQLLGVSIDSEYVHHAWRQAKDELKNLPFETRRAKAQLEFAAANYEGKRSSEGAVATRGAASGRARRSIHRANPRDARPGRFGPVGG